MVASSPYFIAGVLLFLTLGPAAISSEAYNVIDSEPLDVASHIDQLCDPNPSGKSILIIRVSTITKLHTYFANLPATERASCRNFYLGPLAELRILLEVGSRDVCSSAMMDQINQFHWRYIVGGLSKRWRKASQGTLPGVLRVFFMNYAQQVTEVCKDTLIGRLELASRDIDIMAESKELNFIVDQLTSVLRPKNKINKHDDFILLWDHVLDKARRKGEPVEQETDPVTNETVFTAYRMRNPQGIWSIQRRCRQNLRPIYLETVLPVMRLISLGYDGAERGEGVAGSELLRSWYELTQLCQLMLPINFYRDDSIAKEQAIVMALEEFGGAPTPSDSLAPEKISFETKAVQLDDVLEWATNDKVAKLVRANLKARGRILRRLSFHVLRSLEGQLRSKLKHLLVSKKVGATYVVEDVDEAAEEALASGATELVHDDDELGDGKQQMKPARPVKKKRGLIKYIIIFFLFYLTPPVIAMCALLFG